MTLRSALPCRHKPISHAPSSIVPIPTLPSSVDSSGTKRKRSGRPVSLFLNRRGQHSGIAHAFGTVLPLFQSGSEDSSSSSDSDSDSYRDHESENSDDAAEESILDRDPELGSLRAPLLQLSFNQLKSWMTSTRYVAPPQDRLPARKRSKTANWRPRSTYLVEEDEGHSDSELVVISRVEGYFHLACPFYVSNPTKYRPCLSKHDLQTIEDVIDHLRRHHMEPPYCPMCRRPFEKFFERDQHVRSKTCESTDSGDIDGINAYQEARLLKRDRLYYSEKKRWLRLWATIFPNTESPRSPYLEDDSEREVSMVRDYWTNYGRDTVAQFLASRSLPRGDQLEKERLQTALYQSTLEGLLGKISEKHWSS